MDLAGGSEQRNPEFTGLHHGRCHSLALPWMGAGGWAHQASWDEEPLTTLRHSGDADPVSQPASQGRAKSRWPWLSSRTRVIQLEGDGTTRASEGRSEAPPKGTD
jgi:hypothetical protein